MASLNPFPLMPPRSTELRLSHFDENVYKGGPTTTLYKLVDALCGDSGAGDLIKQYFLARMGAALETIYFNDLDYIFGNVSFMARSPAETYAYNPMTDMLTSDQWDEVRVKDAWYRARVKDFFIACGMGGTPQGVRMCVQAAVAVDCDLFEVWRYNRNFGLGDNLGRSPSSADNELVIKPHKDSLSPAEFRLLRDMLDKIRPFDSIFTISMSGLAVATPLGIQATTADSTYFEVQKVVTGSPILASLPAPELLAIDLDPTEQWLFSHSPELAPYAAFNITQEYGYYYLVGGGKRSPIDAVTYGTLQSDGSIKPEPNFEIFQTQQQFTAWQSYATADSPDNYPGGKFGLTPNKAPALNDDGSPYLFPFKTQQEYVNQRKAEVIAMGGNANDNQYQLPIQKSVQSKIVFTPDLAVAFSPPAKDSTVTSSWLKDRTVSQQLSMRDHLPLYVRSAQQ
jgi:hypothetical protein